jgi:hypothetical protein
MQKDLFFICRQGKSFTFFRVRAGKKRVEERNFSGRKRKPGLEKERKRPVSQAKRNFNYKITGNSVISMAGSSNPCLKRNQ